MNPESQSGLQFFLRTDPLQESDKLNVGEEIRPGLRKLDLKVFGKFGKRVRKNIHYYLFTPNDTNKSQGKGIRISEDSGIKRLQYIVPELPDVDKFLKIFWHSFGERTLPAIETHLLSTIKDNKMLFIDPSDYASAEIAHQGLPTSVIDMLVSTGLLTPGEVHALIIPERTLRERNRKEKTLNQAESDRLLRVLRVIEHAERVFEDRTRALRWLRKPKRRLDGKTPIEILDTDAGASTVINWLDQIEYGIAA